MSVFNDELIAEDAPSIPITLAQKDGSLVNSQFMVHAKPIVFRFLVSL